MCRASLSKLMVLLGLLALLPMVALAALQPALQEYASRLPVFKGQIPAVVASAQLVADRMNAGGTVGVSGVGHVILDEVKTDMKAPWKGFQAVNAVSTAYKKNLRPGDLLVWIAYVGMNSAYDDYAKYIKEAGLQLITCYAPDKEWGEYPTDVLAHIDQCWQLPDAEVSIPLFPEKMAPVSGINSGLILRMLDDEVAARLKK